MQNNTTNIKYECCYCKTIFPADAAIDAYDKGHKIGFLCPNCGKNIIAGVFAKQKLRPGDSLWLIVAGVLFLPVFFTQYSDALLSILDKELELNTVLFVLWLVFVCVLLVLRPSPFRNKTFLTTPVTKK